MQRLFCLWNSASSRFGATLPPLVELHLYCIHRSTAAQSGDSGLQEAAVSWYSYCWICRTQTHHNGFQTKARTTAVKSLSSCLQTENCCNRSLNSSFIALNSNSGICCSCPFVVKARIINRGILFIWPFVKHTITNSFPKIKNKCTPSKWIQAKRKAHAHIHSWKHTRHYANSQL